MVFKDPIEGNAIDDLEKANLSVEASVAKLQVMVIFQFVKKIIVILNSNSSIYCTIILLL